MWHRKCINDKQDILFILKNNNITQNSCVHSNKTHPEETEVYKIVCNYTFDTTVNTLIRYFVYISVLHIAHMVPTTSNKPHLFSQKPSLNTANKSDIYLIWKYQKTNILLLGMFDVLAFTVWWKNWCVYTCVFALFAFLLSEILQRLSLRRWHLLPVCLTVKTTV